MKDGFALPAVLVITGAVCLALLAAVGAVDSLARSAHETVERSAFEARALDVEARAIFALLTTASSTNALMTTDARGEPAPILLDGTSYALASGLNVSLQDEAGLVNLNALPVAAYPRLFEQLGVPPVAALTLSDQLADYTDRDDLIRPRGAEAADYAAAGRAPPPNAPFINRAQLLGLLGWREIGSPDAWRTARGLVVADSRDIGVNINTSPEAALVVRHGLTPAQAARAAARRAVRPFVTIEDMGRAAGVRLVGDAERRVDRPNGRVRFALASTRGPRLYSSRIVLTPKDGARPFIVEDRGVTLPPVTGKAKAVVHAAPPALAGN